VQRAFFVGQGVGGYQRGGGKIPPKQQKQHINKKYIIPKNIDSNYITNRCTKLHKTFAQNFAQNQIIKQENRKETTNKTPIVAQKKPELHG